MILLLKYGKWRHIFAPNTAWLVFTGHSTLNATVYSSQLEKYKSEQKLHIGQVGLPCIIVQERDCTEVWIKQPANICGNTRSTTDLYRESLLESDRVYCINGVESDAGCRIAYMYKILYVYKCILRILYKHITLLSRERCRFVGSSLSAGPRAHLKLRGGGMRRSEEDQGGVRKEEKRWNPWWLMLLLVDS